MTTLAQARAKLSELSTKALTALDDPTMTTAQKKAVCDKLDPEMQHWQSEVKDLQSLAVNRKGLLDMGSSPEYRAANGWVMNAPGAPGSHAAPDDLAEVGMSTKAAPPVRVDGDTVREMFAAARGRKSFAVDITTKTTASSAVGPTGVPDIDRDPALVRREPNRILDMIPSRAVASPIVEYFVQTTSATAGVVAEGAVKPGSDLAMPMQTARAAKIAGWVDVTDEALADFDQFYSVVTNDLSAAVVDAENVELLSGTGVGPRFVTGILATTGILTRAFSSTTDTYAVDTLDLAEADLRNGPAYAEVSAWVMHPTTFSRTRRAKDTQGRYVLNPDPTGETAHQLWGKPVVLTTKMPTGTALGADFADACRGFVREGIRVTMSNSTTDATGVSNFKKNVTTVLAEERVGMYVRRPAAVITVTGLPT